jgi:nickel/cobalt transporter (NiCoT) family protein
MLHDRLQRRDPVTGWIAGLDLNTLGFLVVGLFAVVWAAAAAYWRLVGGEGCWRSARSRVHM